MKRLDAAGGRGEDVPEWGPEVWEVVERRTKEAREWLKVMDS